MAEGWNAAEAHAEERVSASGCRKPSRREGVKPMRLVLCDDNRILCEALTVVLERRGHKVLATAITTVRGIAAVAEYQPGACLLDLKFPDPPDGLAAAQVIRHRHPGTAVLLLSGLI